MKDDEKALQTTGEATEKLVQVMKKLRAPDGCPWDREQTHESLMPFLLEECGEFLDALAAKDDENMREELGDVLMQVVLHSVIAEERGKFTFRDVVEDETRKMIYRHPHVFSNAHVSDASEVLVQWEKLKEKEANHEKKHSLLDGIPAHAPALLQAEKIQKRAAKTGFDWKKQEEILEKIHEEYLELKEAMSASDGSEEAETRIDGELGDLLFACANLSRFRKRRSGELLLAASSAKFRKRFQFVEEKLASSGRKFEECTAEELDELWEEAKAQENRQEGC
ncbi:MAG: nucleoside triphosphate pyrophosphohydrolase [Lentisphaeria bacterium]|nr:nucleoside triphosphate pyrophosphohydrolase [Lentisphaeria bacterium]